VPSWTGVLSALAYIVGLPLIPLWGVWAEKYSRKAVIARSAYVEMVVFLVLAVSQNVYQLAIGAALIGLQLGNTGVMLAAPVDRSQPLLRAALCRGADWGDPGCAAGAAEPQPGAVDGRGLRAGRQPGGPAGDPSGCVVAVGAEVPRIPVERHWQTASNFMTMNTRIAARPARFLPISKENTA
jgi:hypothetical protein